MKNFVVSVVRFSYGSLVALGLVIFSTSYAAAGSGIAYGRWYVEQGPFEQASATVYADKIALRFECHSRASWYASVILPGRESLSDRGISGIAFSFVDGEEIRVGGYGASPTERDLSVSFINAQIFSKLILTAPSKLQVRFTDSTFEKTKVAATFDLDDAYRAINAARQACGLPIQKGFN
jgi:hypothetical protein